MKYQLKNLEETKALANNIATNLTSPSLIFLKGDLGAGKTTFTQFLIHALTKNQELEVTSPTFNIVHTYEENGLCIWHFDLYRIKSSTELYELGINEALADIAIIEWPEIAADILPEPDIIIELKYADSISERLAKLSIAKTVKKNMI